MPGYMRLDQVRPGWVRLTRLVLVSPGYFLLYQVRPGLAVLD